MAITQADIKLYKSAVGASAGGAQSATLVTSAKNNYWEDISDGERTAGGSKVKKCFLANDNGTDPFVLPVIWIGTSPTGCTYEIGLGWNDSEDDDSAQGNMVAWSGSAKLTVESDGSDARTVEVYGKNSSGDATKEIVTLNGTTPIQSQATWLAVYACRVSTVDGSRTVTIKQSGIGTARGTIGPTYKTCWLWLSPQSKTNGIRLPSLVAGGEYGIWERLTWPAAVAGIDLADAALAAERYA